MSPSGQTATPTASPDAGAVSSGSQVTLACETEGAQIYYTLDGSDPSDESTLYENAIEISLTEAVTIKAKAYAEGKTPSDVLTAAYTIQSTQTATPTASPAAGEVASGTTVALSCETENARIYYTTDGSNPTQSATLYENAITVTEAVTIKAKAYAEGHTASDVLTAAYTISG